MLVVASSGLLGCDPGYGVAAVNESREDVLVRMVFAANEAEQATDGVYRVPAGRAAWIAIPTIGIGPIRIEILRTDCSIVATVDETSHGTVNINSALAVRYSTGFHSSGPPLLAVDPDTHCGNR